MLLVYLQTRMHHTYHQTPLLADLRKTLNEAIKRLEKEGALDGVPDAALPIVVDEVCQAHIMFYHIH